MEDRTDQLSFTSKDMIASSHLRLLRLLVLSFLRQQTRVFCCAEAQPCFFFFSKEILIPLFFRRKTCSSNSSSSNSIHHSHLGVSTLRQTVIRPHDSPLLPHPVASPRFLISTARDRRRTTERRLFCSPAFSSSVYQFGWRFIFFPSSLGRRGEGGGTSILRCTIEEDECVQGQRCTQYAYNQEINAGPS